MARAVMNLPDQFQWSHYFFPIPLQAECNALLRDLMDGRSLAPAVEGVRCFWALHYFWTVIWIRIGSRFWKASAAALMRRHLWCPAGRHVSSVFLACGWQRDRKDTSSMDGISANESFETSYSSDLVRSSWHGPVRRFVMGDPDSAHWVMWESTWRPPPTLLTARPVVHLPTFHDRERS